MPSAETESGLPGDFAVLGCRNVLSKENRGAQSQPAAASHLQIGDSRYGYPTRKQPRSFTSSWRCFRTGSRHFAWACSMPVRPCPALSCLRCHGPYAGVLRRPRLRSAVLSKHVDDCKGAGPRVETVSESGLANYDQQATLPHAIQPMVHGQDAGSNCTSLQSQLTLVSVDVNICFRDSQDAVPLVQQLWWEVASRYNWIYNPLLLTWPSRVHPESPSQLLYFSYTVPGTDYSQEGQTCFEGATCCCSQPATWHIRASFRATSMAKEFKQRIMEGLAYDAMEKTGALCLAPRHAGGSMTHLNTTA